MPVSSTMSFVFRLCLLLNFSVFCLAAGALAKPAFAQTAPLPATAYPSQSILPPVVLSNLSSETFPEPKSIFVIPDPGRKLVFNSVIEMVKNAQILSINPTDSIISLGAERTWVVIPALNKSNHQIWSFNFGTSQDGRLGFAQAILYESTTGQTFSILPFLPAARILAPCFYRMYLSY